MAAIGSAMQGVATVQLTVRWRMPVATEERRIASTVSVPSPKPGGVWIKKYVAYE